MNLTQAYFNSRPDIRHVVFFVGTWHEEAAILDLLEQTRLTSLVIAGTMQPQSGEAFAQYVRDRALERGIRLPDRFAYQGVGSIEPPADEPWALTFTHIDYPSELLPFVRLAPQHIAGSLWQDGFAFSVWELFRKTTPHMRIETLRAGMQSKVLSWDARKDSDIELSVIVPMYNVEPYLARCIQTVTARDDDWLELLFVNDGSPDDSRGIVLAAAQKDGRIKLLDKENGGCASARQYALERASGRYVGFIDPDDFVDPDFFRTLLAAALTGSYEVAYCGYNELYEQTGGIQPKSEAFGAEYTAGTTDAHAIRRLVAYSHIAIWRRIYSREMLERAGIGFYTELRRFDDLPFKAEVFAAARSVIAVPRHLYYYRLNRPGQDVSCDDERLGVHFDIFRHLDTSIAARNDEELTEWLQVVKIQTHRWAIGKIRRQYRAAYCRRAIQDLGGTGSFRTTLRLCRARCGRRAAWFYVLLRLRLYAVARRFCP